MASELQIISLPSLALAFIPVTIVIAIFYAWRCEPQTALYAMVRMVIQLLLVGYFLNYIFDSDSSLVVAGMLAFMLIAASWIALRTVAGSRRHAFKHALFAIGLASLFTLGLITQLVLDIEPWYEPRYMLPLGGMIFASCMNAVSLAAERFELEINSGKARPEAQRASFQTALIPMINSLFAVGVVSLPGMMTGQVLSGISPMVAARYQIMVMCMLFGASGIAAAIYLVLDKRD
jgi:putative ABC transport system permease protein